jgi:glycosyltransferase involved in cell wall biosynthesis
MSAAVTPTSIVIAAHNEERAIGACLDAILRDARPGEFHVVVAANGCTDRTAAVAASRAGVEVLDLPMPGKCAALNAADAIAIGFPRIYLDADIHVTTESLRLLRDSLDPAAGVLAVVPTREVDARGSSLLVRAYSAVNARLPVFRNSLFGRGLIVLSAEGRARFDRFPEIVADDLYLDSLFSTDEKKLVEAVTTTVGAPAHARELLRRLVRVRRGNAALRATSAALPGSVEVRRSSRTSWLVDVVLPHPTLLPAGLVYASITALAGVLARRGQISSTQWGTDPASRRRPGA